MNQQSAINKKAWEHKAYEFWLKNDGLPRTLAKKIMENPMARLKKHGKYFEDIKGSKIANPCGSNVRRALALSLLGADVTVFDISEENKQYAVEMAAVANAKLDYVVGDVYDIDLSIYGHYFDMLYLEGGILHYFHDLDRFFKTLYWILKPGGKIVLNDFHPFRKVMAINYYKSTCGDYFDTGIHEGDVAYKDFMDDQEAGDFPSCSLRYYNISEVLNTLIRNGFTIKEFNEDPSWTNEKLPGEMTIYANK